MNIENEHLFRNALSSGVNLFLGAGFSVLAEDKNGHTLPIGNDLSTEISSHLGLPTNLELPQLCKVASRSKKTELREFLINRFTVSKFSEQYSNILNAKISKIFTTNIDDLLYKIFEESTDHYLNDLDVRGASYSDKLAIDIVSLHGSVIDRSRDFTFTPQEISSAFRSDPDRWHFLTEAMQEKPTLFWGYGINDSGTLEALSPESISGRLFKDSWILLRDDTDEGYIDYFRAMDLQVIKGDTVELLEYFSSVSSEEKIDYHRIENKFRDMEIPSPVSVPAVPVLEFYRGSPPQWYHIFHSNLFRSKYNLAIRNALSSRKTTIITGIPACGKTTLLMQVMTEFPFDGIKLICSSISEEKANILSKELKYTKLLLAIDNFSDSINSVILLSRNHNIQLLVADRSYNFEIISHMLDLTRSTVVDVSELDESDVSTLLNSIPDDVKKASDQIPRRSYNKDNSIFEIVENNLWKINLKKRYRSVLEELNNLDVRLAEFMVVSSYVHRCRTPISMDMLLAYFRDDIDGYSEIYRLKEHLGEVVKEYADILDDGNQDYFSPRSEIVSEAVISQVKDKLLKLVILKFHKNVSTFRIHRHDIFRTKAFDAYLMRKVFDNWEEGLQFYQHAHRRDNSPYLLQQGALYLMHKKRFTESFSMIDEALIESHQRIQSIKNTHAIILFRANINKEESNTVVDMLKQSMDILSECYHRDRRKAYHAVTMADHALQYESRFGRNKGAVYLETASTWLESENKRNPWNRNVRRLQRRVRDRLQS